MVKPGYPKKESRLRATASDTVDWSEQIAAAAEALRPTLLAWRRDFHMHPELSDCEERTAGIVAERLRALGLSEIRTKVARHGVVGLLKGGRPGPVVAIRADMDALPIQETLDVPYKSQVPGVKHACGHDVHTAVALGVAEVLSKMRDQLPGTIKFIFQPAEEGSPDGRIGGAALMIKEGALENPRPQAIFALHVTPEVEVGLIAVRAGSAQAASDRLDVTIRGKSAHAAEPALAIDAIVVAAECISALQVIRSRRIDTFEPLVITVGTINGGTRYNVIADEVKFEGTIRAFSEGTRQKVKTLIPQIIKNVCSAHNADCTVTLTEGAAPVYNAPALVETSLPALRRAVGEKNVVEAQPRMGAEDFCYFQQVIPGFLFRLGTRNEKRGIVADVHTPEFDVDEESLVIGVKAMTNVLVDFLQQHKNA